MLDLKRILANPDAAKDALRRRGTSFDKEIDRLIELNRELLRLKPQAEELVRKLKEQSLALFLGG